MASRASFALIDKWVVHEPILNLNEAIIGRDAGMSALAQNDGYDVHPNGHCHSEVPRRQHI